MPLIDLDTDQLRGAVSTAEVTNEAISEAVDLLERIVIHNDWICKERDAINNNTRANQQTSRVIQERSAAFYKAIKFASDLFDETEQADVAKLNRVDEAIARVATVTQGSFGDTGSGPAIVDFGSMSSSISGSEG